MPTLSARFIRKSRRLRHCDDCDRIIGGPCIRLYGMADVGDKPFNLYLHPECVIRYGKLGTQDPKVLRVIAELVPAAPPEGPEGA